MKRISPKLVKKNRTYTLLEISRLFKIHRRTAQLWIRAGLLIVDKNTRPYLIEGKELKRFLKDRWLKRKVKLNDDEFFCTRCKSSTKSMDDKITYDFTGKIIGKNELQTIIKGICNQCGCQLNKFSTERIITNLIIRKVFPEKRDTLLIESVNSTLNVDIKETLDERQ